MHHRLGRKICTAGIVVWALLSLCASAAPISLLSVSQGDNPTPQPTPDLQTLPPSPESGPYILHASQPAAAVVYSASAQESLVSETGSSVTIITAAELEQRKITTVADALRSVPGVDVTASGGPGQLTSVFIRGAASNLTLLMVDGVLINDSIYPGRGADISKLTVDNVERIEIVRGPLSATYGSGAMGGVINIITRRKVANWLGTVDFSVGKYSTYLGALTAAGSTGPLDASFGGSYTGTDGFSAARRDLAFPEPQPALLPNGYHNLTTDLNVGYQALSNLSFRVTNRFIRGDNQLDNSGGDYGDAADYRMNFLQEISHLESGLDLWDKLWQQKLSVGFSRWERTTRNNPGAPLPVVNSDYHSSLWSVDWRHQFKSIVLGVNYRQEQGRFHDETGILFGDPPSDFPAHSAHLVGLYLEDQFHLDALTVDAGARWDTHDQFGSATTYRVTPVYTFAQTGTRLKATYGTAFNAPSLDQLYSSFGNTGLRPENSAGWDAGVEQDVAPNLLSLGGTYFQTDFQDQITFDFATSKYRNLGRVQTKGWEGFAHSQPWTDLDLRLTYTKLTANDLTDADTLGPQTLVRRADYKLTLDAGYRFQGAQLHLNLMRVGPRWDFDPNTFARISLAPYTVANLTATYAVLRDAEVYLKIDNILDADYVEVAGYTTPRFEAFAGIKLALR